LIIQKLFANRRKRGAAIITLTIIATHQSPAHAIIQKQHAIGYLRQMQTQLIIVLAAPSQNV
jgi:hypothetical protein